MKCLESAPAFGYYQSAESYEWQGLMVLYLDVLLDYALFRPRVYVPSDS